MAGYGISLKASPEFDDLVLSLLKATQRRARALGLRMHYRKTVVAKETEWNVNVDGPGGRIAALAYQLERDLPVVSEGFIGIMAGKTARNVAESFVARWIGTCVGHEDDIVIKSTGRDPVKWFWPVIEVPDPPSPLAKRLVVSDSIIARWLTSDLEEEVVIEELHTVVEGLLRSLLTNGNGKWPALLQRAKNAGLLTNAEIKTLQIFSTKYRNRMKHRAEAIADSDRQATRDLMLDVLDAADRLSSRA